MTRFRLAHLSDLHLRLEGHVPLSALFGKRAIGYVSWRHRRRRIHRHEMLQALIDDLREQQVDHVVVTGDLVNLSLPQEFVAASLWLKKLGNPRDVTVVPGNHDAYVPTSWRKGWALWQPFMSDDKSRFGDPITFPFVRERGAVTLVGLSSAVPTAPLLASGKIGSRQLERLNDTLEARRDRDRFRVILVHHSPAAGASRHDKRLRDAARLRRSLQKHGADLVLSGHEHKFSRFELPGASNSIPAVCAPSASHANEQAGRGGGYVIYTIDRNHAGAASSPWQLRIEHRSFHPQTLSLVAAGDEFQPLPA